MICRGFLTPKKIKTSGTHTPELRGTYGSLGKSKKPLSPSREAGKESAVSGTSVPYEPGAHPIGAPIKTPNEGHTILSDDEIRRALTRIAFEILESNKGTDNLVLLGIRSRGYPLAQRLAQRIQTNDSNFDLKNGLGALDITSYRDDLTDEEYENRSAGECPLCGAGRLEDGAPAPRARYAHLRIPQAYPCLHRHEWNIAKMDKQ